MLRFVLAHSRDLEPQRDPSETIRLLGRAGALDGDVHPCHRNALLLRVALDQRDAARRHAGEKGLAVGEGVGLGVRRRVEVEALTTRLVHGTSDRAAAGRLDGVDLHVAHDGASLLDPSVVIDSSSSAAERNCTLIRSSAWATFGTACSQVSWQSPPMTIRSPRPRLYARD